MNLYPSLEELVDADDRGPMVPVLPTVPALPAKNTAIVPSTMQVMTTQLPQLIKRTGQSKPTLKGSKFITHKTGVFIKRTGSEGLKVGDQILSINSINIAGMKGHEVESLVERIDASKPADVAVKNRPYAKCHILTKGDNGLVGVVLKNKKITHIVHDSSSARNGVLIHHYIVEVNGIDSVDLTNDQLVTLIKEQPGTVVSIVLFPEEFYKLIK